MKLVSSKKVHENPIFQVTEDEVIAPDGFQIKRAIVQHAGSAVILVMDEKKRILLVKQFRLPAKQYLWELPAGRLDPGETPLKAAKRELTEETGFKAKNWKKITQFYPSPGFLAEKMTLFLATELTEGEATPMEDENIEMEWFAPRKVEEMIKEGQIQDGKTLVGYLTWYRFHRGA